jgi:hypothetical protein
MSCLPLGNYLLIKLTSDRIRRSVSVQIEFSQVAGDFKKFEKYGFNCFDLQSFNKNYTFFNTTFT